MKTDSCTTLENMMTFVALYIECNCYCCPIDYLKFYYDNTTTVGRINENMYTKSTYLIVFCIVQGELQ